MQIQIETWSRYRDEFDRFLDPTVRSHIPIHVLQTFLFPIAFFSECLNLMPGVLVAASERRGDKNKDIYLPGFMKRYFPKI